MFSRFFLRARIALALFAAASGSLAMAAPTLTEELLPQYMQGASGTNNNRTPCAFRVKLSGLTPSTTHRYYNQAVTTTETAVATISGSGNPIFVSTSGSFSRASDTGLFSSGKYSTFTSDSNGDYEGWFMVEPTSNWRFATGNELCMRITYTDLVTTERLTTTNSIKTLDYSATSSAPYGTGIYCTSNTLLTAKNFIFLYDAASPSASDRPLAGASIESDGATAASSYVTFYKNNVEGKTGAWGAIVPNVLANGVRRIEERSLSDGTIVSSSVSNDGSWAYAGSTVNPTAGSTGIAFQVGDLPVELSQFSAE